MLPVEPNRLEAAKQAARDFVDQVAPDIEVGLISFSGTVGIEVPPTLDRDQLDRGIDNLELAESTAIGDALATGANLLSQLAENSNADGSSTQDDELAPGAMVLLTDGETTVGRPTDEGGRVAAEAGVPVFTIAFGTAEGTIVEPQSGDTFA